MELGTRQLVILGRKLLPVEEGRYFILKGHEIVPSKNTLEWARWFENADRRVAEAWIGQTRVSTVFLGINHQFGDGPPLVFETMVFGGPLDGIMSRYSTWEFAERGHCFIVKRVKFYRHFYFPILVIRAIRNCLP